MDERIEAAIAWLVTGNADAASRLCNIPSRTIRDWMVTDWWESILEAAKGIKQKELDAIWTGIIHKTADELRDRIVHGDEVIDRMGGSKRVKVKGKDLAIIMSIATDKRALGRGQATSRKESVSIEKRLEAVGNKLQQVDEEAEDKIKTH